jgi:hypothetical protein
MITTREDPLPSEKDALIRLVKGVVLAQGNMFIKELLRSRGIKIGTTKAEFETNMLGAIESGDLRRQHVDSWLAEVEGWGNQHIYLFRTSKSLRNDPIWHDPGKVESKVRSAGFAKQWNSQASLEYPPGHTLTGIYFENGTLRFVWHKGLEFWVRAKQKDYKEEIEADTYEFRAYRMRGDRLVTRFEIRPSDGLAAAFLQMAVEEDEHKVALENIKKVVGRLWSFDEFEPMAVAKAIKTLDAEALNNKGVSAHSTRLNSGDAYVEFGVRSAQSSYQDSTPVRDARRAVRLGSFTGMHGTFVVPTGDDSDAVRKVRVQLYGGQRRVKIASQMTAPHVWGVLGLIAESA